MYNWAVSKSKLERAIAMVPGQPEEAIKEAYIRLGGLVKEDKPKLVTTEVTPEEMDNLDNVPSIDTIKESENVEVPIVAPKAKKFKTPKQSPNS